MSRTLKKNDRPKRNIRRGKHRKEPDFGTLCPEVASGQLVPKLRGACLVAASCVSFASARWRKLTRSAAAPLPTKQALWGPHVGNTPQEWGRKPFRGERQRKAKWRERMRDSPYKDLPPLERRPDGSLYRMTPAQRKQVASLIRRECCCCEDGNCIVLDDGD